MRRCAAGATLFLTLAIAAGCKVGPDFKAPQFPDPGRLTGAALPAETMSSPVAGGDAQRLVAGAAVSGQWWLEFRSPVIASLVDQALRHNPTIAAARATLSRGLETNAVDRGNIYPSVSGYLARTREREPLGYEGYSGSSASLTFSEYQAELSLSYQPDLWGGLRRAAEQSAAEAESARFELEAAYLAISAGIVSSVINYAAFDAQIRAQQSLIDLEERQLAAIQMQLQIGAASGADVATQDAQVASAKAALVPLKLQMAQAFDQIAAFLGEAPATASLGKVDLDTLVLPRALPVSLPAALLRQRPDVRAAQAILHAQTAGLGVAIAQRLPNVSILPSIGSDASNPHLLFSPETGLWSLTLQALQPIFDAGQLLHKQRAQREAMREAAEQWRATVVGAFQNTADVLNAVYLDSESLRRALEADAAAEKSLSLTTAQFHLGAGRFLDVIVAEQTARASLVQLIHARAQRYLDAVLLYQALGGGWWERDDVKMQVPVLIPSPLP